MNIFLLRVAVALKIEYKTFARLVPLNGGHTLLKANTMKIKKKYLIFNRNHEKVNKNNEKLNKNNEKLNKNHEKQNKNERYTRLNYVKA